MSVIGKPLHDKRKTSKVRLLAVGIGLVILFLGAAYTFVNINLQNQIDETQSKLISLTKFSKQTLTEFVETWSYELLENNFAGNIDNPQEARALLDLISSDAGSNFQTYQRNISTKYHEDYKGLDLETYSGESIFIGLSDKGVVRVIIDSVYIDGTWKIVEVASSPASEKDVEMVNSFLL